MLIENKGYTPPTPLIPIPVKKDDAPDKPAPEAEAETPTARPMGHIGKVVDTRA